MTRVKVLIIDDSTTMRSLVKVVLRRDKDIEIVGEAANAYEAREKVKALNPDVLILDIEMPGMSGLEFLKRLMMLRPMPVVMLSSSTHKDAADTIQALSMGVFECLEKPKSGDYLAALSSLPKIIKAAVIHHVNGGLDSGTAISPTAQMHYETDGSIIGIGSSTGGVEALTQILITFPKNCPPTVITQHMPQAFLKSFSERLNGLVAPKVSIAKHGDALKVGQIYFAPGGDAHLQIKGRTQLLCSLLHADTVSGHRPSVDVMFSSMAKSVKGKGIGVILTGLGRDGAQGLLAMRQAGAKTIGQNEKSCIVYGMPKVAKEIGAVQQEYHISKIGRAIIETSDRNAIKRP
ncbi:chemotaxis response regulator protein-glutamate methylesterase [Hellea sp.]|nr:chemotaxis response regulator protein-glutamate methylesterase [Hellea sp.]